MAAGGSGTIANLQVNVGADVAAALLGFATLQGAIGALVDQVKQFVSTGIEFDSMLESTQLQFKTLMGSAAEANTRVKELFDLAAHTPFTFESVTVAARQLEVFGGAALDTQKNLIMLGDAAAATGASIQEVTFWTGRLYGDLQAGKPFGEASRWLQRMGVMSAETRLELEHLQATGASGNEIWDAYTKSMQRFAGAMKEQEGTWRGLTSTMQDTFAQFSGAVMGDAFKSLEGDLKQINATLSDPQTAKSAREIGAAIGFIADEGAKLAGTVIAVAPITQVVNAYTSLLDLKDRLTGQADAVAAANSEEAETHRELARALTAHQMAAQDAADATDDLTAAEQRAQAAHQALMETARDETERILQVKGALDIAASSAADYRDESYRAAAAQQILNQQMEDARRIAAAGAEDMFTRHPTLDMGVLTGGDLSGIDAILKRKQDAARAAEQAAREQAQAEKAAARESAQAQTAAAKTTEREWTAAHATVAASAVQAARVQVAAAQAVAAATRSLGLPDMGGVPFDPSEWHRDPKTGNVLPPTFTIGGRRLAPPPGALPYTQNVNITVNGDVYDGQRFQQRVTDAVQQADRTGGLTLTRYATR